MILGKGNAMNVNSSKPFLETKMLHGALSILWATSTAWAGPPPYPKDLGMPNILTPKTVIGGAFGTAIGQFNEPHGIDFASDDRILIADKHNNRICLLSSSFKMEKCIKPKNGIDLLAPTTVRWIGKDRFLVADTGNGRVVEMHLDGTVRRTSSTNSLKMSEPTGVTTLLDRVYVVDKSGQQLHILDKNLFLIRSIGGPGDSDGFFVDPSSVTSNSRNRIYVADSYNNRIQIFDYDGRYVGKFGDWGSFTGLLANPSSVYYANETIFVADLINHRIQGYDEQGRYLLQWGRHPLINHEGNGRLHYPEQVAVNAAGNTAIVCEPFEHRCQVFDIKRATDVVRVNDQAWWDKNGRFHYGARPTNGGGMLAISEPDTHSVLLFDIKGKDPRFVARVGGQGRELGSLVKPSGVALSPDGKALMVSDSGNFRISSFDLKPSVLENSDRKEEQKLVRTSSTISLDREIQRKANIALLNGNDESKIVIEPSALQFTREGTVLMCDPNNGRVLEMNADLTPLRYIIPRAPKEMPGFRPNDLAISPDGERIYIVDFYHSRVGIFDRKGKFLSKFGKNGTLPGHFIHAFGITISKTGEIYVSDEALNRISRFDRNGKLLSTWGSWGAAPGQFYKPKGLTYDHANDRIIVADFGNHRAQIFDTNGGFITTFGIGQGYVPYLMSKPNLTALALHDGGSTPSNGGNFVIDYRSSSTSFTAGKDNALSFQVRKYNGASVDDSIKIRVSAMMPSHYHGLNQNPQLNKTNDGNWLVEGINFHMPGHWQVYFDIDNGIVVERAQVDIVVK
ncbi:6-bladed beta-propeller [Pseudoduganella buxea]|nr:6-bladed beta-propeller [Pseudoduganella buxea]